MRTDTRSILDEGPAQAAQADRWERFALRYDTECPGCGYSLRGLPDDRCPECGATIDTATMMYCSEPLELASLGRSARWCWGVLAANAALLATTHLGLAPLHIWPPDTSPPAGWYGVTTLRILWCFLMAASIFLWRIQIAQERSGLRHDDPVLDRALRTAHFGALAGTLVHAAWVGVRLLIA